MNVSPALGLIGRCDTEDTLFYVDPPYPMSVRNTHTEMDKVYKHELTINQHRELAEILHKVQGYVILSGYSCRLYDEELYPDWKRYDYHTQSLRASSRTECIYLNARAARSLKSGSLFD